MPSNYNEPRRGRLQSTLGDVAFFVINVIERLLNFFIGLAKPDLVALVGIQCKNC